MGNAFTPAGTTAQDVPMSHVLPQKPSAVYHADGEIHPDGGLILPAFGEVVMGSPVQFDRAG